MSEFDTIEFGGWVFPAGEIHLQDIMGPASKHHRIVKGRWHYQYHKLERALKYCQPDRRRIAIDVGAHCGTWLFHLVDEFRFVHAYEPIPIHQHCLMRNMATAPTNWQLWNQGLSDRCDVVTFTTYPWSTGGSHIGEGRAPDASKGIGVKIPNVYVGYLDQSCYAEVDFIKIDVEGHELQVCQGAKETLERCKPVVIIEQKGRDEITFGRAKDEALKYLQSLGMEVNDVISGDYILTFPS